MQILGFFSALRADGDQVPSRLNRPGDPSSECLLILKTAAIGFSGITWWNCRRVISGWTGAVFDFGLMPLCPNFLDVTCPQYDAIGDSRNYLSGTVSEPDSRESGVW